MKKSELRALIREVVDEIAANYKTDDGGYNEVIEYAAKIILKAIKELGEMPDINPIIEKIAAAYDKSEDDVHQDVARAAHKMKV